MDLCLIHIHTSQTVTLESVRKFYLKILFIKYHRFKTRKQYHAPGIYENYEKLSNTNIQCVGRNQTLRKEIILHWLFSIVLSSLIK